MSQLISSPPSSPPKKIWFGSDFHYERYGNLVEIALNKDDFPAQAPFDYMVFAGDITHSTHIPALLKGIYQKTGVPILYTPGNHEFWDGVKHKWTFQDQLDYMQEAIGAIEGVTLLYNEGFDIPDTNYSIFMSPWFTNLVDYEDFDRKGNRVIHPQSHIQDCIGDYSRTYWKRDVFLKAENHVQLNNEAVHALGCWLEKDVLSKGRTPIIATHFGPSRKSAHRDFPMRDIVASYFNTNYLDEPGYIWPKGTTWIHGHTHQNLDYMIGDVRVVTNQFGYKGESETNDSYDYMKHIEVY